MNNYKSSNINIMFVSNSSFVMNVFLKNHIIFLAKKFNVILICNDTDFEINPSILELVTFHKIKIYRKISILNDLICMFKISLILKKYKPIIVHSITPKAGILAMASSFFCNVPNRWHTFTGQVWANKRGLYKKFFKIIDKLIIYFSNQTFADSNSQINLLKEEKIISNEKITVLGHGSISGVDIDKFRNDFEFKKMFRKSVGCKQNSCVFLFLGRIKKEKGIFKIFEIFKKYGHKFHNTELWIVGPDEENLKNKLMNSFNFNSPKVRWFDFSPDPEKFMKSSDILLLPSSREGFGSVIIEAASCAVPTIAYDIHGVRDAIINNQTGILIKDKTINSFAEGLLDLFNDKVKRKKMGQNAQVRVLKKFTSKLISKAWYNEYIKYL